jgi:phage baseplate assembly protein W
MAYVIGKKVVKDTEDFDSFAYGLKLPLQRGQNGYFEQNFTSFDQAKSNLLNLLQTQQGERVMQPLYGSGLQNLLFEQMEDGIFETRLQQVITDSVNFWLPYITIESIEVELTDQMKDENKANLKIQFTVGNEIDLQEITFTVSG